MEKYVFALCCTGQNLFANQQITIVNLVNIYSYIYVFRTSIYFYASKCVSFMIFEFIRPA